MSSKFTKFVLFSTITGAAVAGAIAIASNIKNSQSSEENDTTPDNDSTSDSSAPRKYVTIDVDTQKVKDTMQEMYTKAKTTVTDFVEEGKLDEVKDNVVDFAKDASVIIADGAIKAKNYVKDAAEKIKDNSEKDSQVIDVSFDDDTENDSKQDTLDDEFLEDEITDNINE